jgi:2,4-dienoyl-CoA reductase-like NADH-dependent reductase (Old Yellow Enzyme family)
VGEDGRRILQRDRNPHLFRPLTIRSVTARNRIMLSPMCQYSAAADGVATDWHFAHLAARAVGGAGIVFTEATSVEPRGRLTHACLGLWNDAQREALGRIANFVSAQGAVPGIQLAHAGRKASITRPWEGSRPLRPDEGAWETLSATSAPYDERFPAPLAMDARMIDEFVRAAARSAQSARAAGFKVVELHAAHGYLIHQFLSPVSNTRTDQFGGSLTKRARLLMQTIDAVRAEWPLDLPLFVRLSCTDWIDGGWDMTQTIALARMLRERADVDLIDCSSGGIDPRQRISFHPGYQVPFARAVRAATGLATAAIGLIHTADMAEEILGNGDADVVVLGRTLLADPFWPLRAARALRTTIAWPVQYERADIF